MNSLIPDVHLLGCEGLSKQTITTILSLAQFYRNKSDEGERFQLLNGMTVANLFFEPSTRTRTSFEIAAQRLGAQVVNFSSQGSSTSKGETVTDTAKNIEAMDPSILVIRHSSSGIPHLLAKCVKIPILNAGDGFHEHPSQALLDLLTIQQSKTNVQGKKILIVGDIAHSRVARSNIYALNTMGAQVTVCGPPTLIPPFPEKLGVQVEIQLEKALPTADVIMMLRIQFERQSAMQIPSKGEYAKFWGLNERTIRNIKEDAIIMHPGPLNRGVEISPAVADGPYSVILNQVKNGVAVRMALINLYSRAPLPQEWFEAEKRSSHV